MLAATVMKGFKAIMADRARSVKLLCANFLWMALSFRRSYYFRKAASCVEQTQRKVLLRILMKNSSTAFGKEHAFSAVSAVADFQSSVKVDTYDFYKGYIDEIARGKKAVLTADPVVLLEPSSGSTAPSKYIPYNQSLYEEFKNGLSPWIFDLLSKKKQLLSGSAYWSISPVTKITKTDSKIPVGFGDDAGYFGRIERGLLNTIFAVPSRVSEIEEVEAFRYVTLRFLLSDKMAP
jgi:hypothetical protein